eukprot:217311-Amphidinium_carterae.1
MACETQHFFAVGFLSQECAVNRDCEWAAQGHDECGFDEEDAYCADSSDTIRPTSQSSTTNHEVPSQRFQLPAGRNNF